MADNSSWVFLLGLLAWVADHALSHILWEALGLSAITTIAISRLTATLSKFREKIIFGALLFFGLIIAVNMFSFTLYPSLYISIDQVGSGEPTVDHGDQPPGTAVLLQGYLMNRGNVQFSVMDYQLEVELNGKTHKGEPYRVSSPMNLFIWKKTVSLDPTKQLMFRDPILFMPVGYSHWGYLIFYFPEIPSGAFNSLAKYKLTITDSFGHVYHFYKETHGEFSVTPNRTQ